MKITFNWLKDHLDTKLTENQIIDKLTDIGLEVESVDSQSSDLESFVVAKILKSEKHPNADRLKVCDVDIGKKDSIKVVCGAPNAKKDLLTIYAPPGATIPKNKMKLVISKIRGVTSYGMLCSGAELNLSDESEEIVELSNGMCPAGEYQLIWNGKDKHNILVPSGIYTYVLTKNEKYLNIHLQHEYEKKLLNQK